MAHVTQALVDMTFDHTDGMLHDLMQIMPPGADFKHLQ